MLSPHVKSGEDFGWRKPFIGRPVVVAPEDAEPGLIVERVSMTWVPLALWGSTSGRQWAEWRKAVATISITYLNVADLIGIADAHALLLRCIPDAVQIKGWTIEQARDRKFGFAATGALVLATAFSDADVSEIASDELAAGALTRFAVVQSLSIREIYDLLLKAEARLQRSRGLDET